ncbi:MAG: ABC transporter ATP-binding protein [Zestosphaera sp.]
MFEVAVNVAGYRMNEEIIKGIDFKGLDGELILIGGSSGSGKTTLLLTVSGVLTSLLGGWVDGVVKVNDVNTVKALENAVATKLVGLVLQDPEKQVLMPTPLDEVLFTLENLGYEEKDAVRTAMSVLGRFGLTGKELTHVESLSGGEKRRLTLASATPHNPYLVMLDEPTASIDPWGVREVRGYVAELIKEGHAVLVVEHKIKYFIDLAEKLILIDSGRKVAEFSSDELRSRDLLKRLRRSGVDAEPIHEPAEKTCGEKGAHDGVVLKVDDLECWYEEGRPIIRRVSFELRRGEILALVGPNGSGKTTLLKSIAGFHRKCSGEVRIASDKKKVFYVHQTPDYMFLENTLVKELRHVTLKTGVPVEVLSERLPFFTLKKELSPYRLSLGQRRWLTLAIAWAYSPELILLDEPTAGLDLHLLKDFFSFIKTVSVRGTSFIISTHDPRVLSELADRAILLEEGKAREIDPFKAALMLESIAGVY